MLFGEGGLNGFSDSNPPTITDFRLLRWGILTAYVRLVSKKGNNGRMNIDEIRAEIPKALTGSCVSSIVWIRNNGNPTYPDNNPAGDDFQTAARMLVNWAYEAGKADAFPTAEEASQLSIEANIEACNDYQRGYEAAAKDPKAWYVLGANNLPIHIGDTVKSTDPELDHEWDYEQVTGFNFRFDRPQLEYRLGHDYTDEMVKVIPDSWDKFKQDLYRHLHGDNEEYIYDHRTCEDLSRELTARAKKLGAVD